MNLYRDLGLPQSKVGCYILDEYHTGLTLRGLMEIYLLQAEKTATPPVFQRLKSLVHRHILPTLGECEIDYLTQADIDDFLQKKRESGRLNGKGGLSEKVVLRISYALTNEFKLVKWDIQPAEGFIDAPHLKPLDEIMTLDQADNLTRYLTQNLDRRNAGFLLCLYTGIKMSEVCSLRDSDIDLENDVIHIQRTMKRATDGDPTASDFATTDYPEDYYGNRFLRIPVKLSALLWTLLRRSDGNRYFLSGMPDSSINPRRYQDHFKLILADAGLPGDLNFHMLRNTFAWMWLLRGQDLEGLTYAMGYKDITVTKMIYSALLQNLYIRLPGCAKYLSLSEKNR